VRLKQYSAAVRLANDIPDSTSTNSALPSRRSSSKSEKSDRDKPGEQSRAVRRQLNMETLEASDRHADPSQVRDSSESKHRRRHATTEQSRETDASNKSETSSKNLPSEAQRQESRTLKPNASSRATGKPQDKQIHHSSRDAKERKRDSHSEHRMVEASRHSVKMGRASVVHEGSSGDGQKVHRTHLSSRTERREHTVRHTRTSADSEKPADIKRVHSSCTDHAKKDPNTVDLKLSGTGAPEASSGSMADTTADKSSHSLVNPTQQSSAEIEERPGSLSQTSDTSLSPATGIKSLADECETRLSAEPREDDAEELAEDDTVQHVEPGSGCDVNTLLSSDDVHTSTSEPSQSTTTAVTAEDEHRSMDNAASSADTSVQPDLLRQQVIGTEAGHCTEDVEKPLTLTNDSLMSDIVTESVSSVHVDNVECSSVTTYNPSSAASVGADVCTGLRSTVDDSCPKVVPDLLPSVADTGVLAESSDDHASLHQDVDDSAGSHSAVVDRISASSPKPQPASDGDSEAEKNIETEQVVATDDSVDCDHS